MSATGQPPTSRATQIWRWVFLCVAAAQVALTVILIGEGVYHRRLDYESFPLRASFVAFTWVFTTLFWLSVGLFFSRRLGALATGAWLTVALEFLCSMFVELLRSAFVSK